MVPLSAAHVTVHGLKCFPVCRDYPGAHTGLCLCCQNGWFEYISVPAHSTHGCCQLNYPRKGPLLWFSFHVTLAIVQLPSVLKTICNYQQVFHNRVQWIKDTIALFMVLDIFALAVVDAAQPDVKIDSRTGVGHQWGGNVSPWPSPSPSCAFFMSFLFNQFLFVLNLLSLHFLLNLLFKKESKIFFQNKKVMKINLST